MSIMHRVRRKPSIVIKDPREPRRVAAIRRLAEKQAAAGVVRASTRREVDDFALRLAREEFDRFDIGPQLAELFHWPASAAPCMDPRKLFLPFVEMYRKKAAAMLREHSVYYHALDIRRKRWLRAHPKPRTWSWTQKPLKHATPPPKKGMYRPPDLDEYPDCPSPPPPAAEDPSKRPGRRETERILCYDWLFGNGIVVLYCAA
jgi:hypothetical protein